MVRPQRTIAHDDRLSLVEHLDELRSRLIVSTIVLAVVFGVCLWQNHALLRVINEPLASQTRQAVAQGHGPAGQAAITQKALRDLAAIEQQAAVVLAKPGSGLSGPARAQIAPLSREIGLAVARVPRTPQGEAPVTLGIGEPFTSTVMVSLYFALLISMPLILYQLYGFVLPAFSPDERRVATPLMAAVPALFVIGVAFGYFVVLPAAVHFFQNFNNAEFVVLVQANGYYHFAALTLLAMGAVFQVPVAILAAVHAGVVTPAQLRKGRRYAIVAAAAIAALLPGDAVTMLLEMLPLILLYEMSILVASLFERRSAVPSVSGAPAAVSASGSGDAPTPPIPPIHPPTDAI